MTFPPYFISFQHGARAVQVIHPNCGTRAISSFSHVCVVLCMLLVLTLSFSNSHF